MRNLFILNFNLIYVKHFKFRFTNVNLSLTDSWEEQFPFKKH